MDSAITQRLEEWREGRTEAFDAIVPFIYAELHRLAERALHHERPGHTLQPTALVNEVYMRLIGSRIPKLDGRRQFYALAARTMRQILVDHARRHLAGKRGSRPVHLPLDEALEYSVENAAAFSALDQALERLAQIDERKARLVELRYFTGLTVEETADVAGIGVASVYRDLAFATAFIGQQLERS
jgi:RNA polymerase sigma factor (TIGR02999 family)